MGSQSSQHREDDDDWDTEDEDAVAMEDEELELDFEPDEEGKASEAAPARRGGAWRLIEQATEQRMLRMALEDFDDYVI